MKEKMCKEGGRKIQKKYFVWSQFEKSSQNFTLFFCSLHSILVQEVTKKKSKDYERRNYEWEG